MTRLLNLQEFSATNLTGREWRQLESNRIAPESQVRNEFFEQVKESFFVFENGEPRLKSGRITLHESGTKTISQED
jgi:hypothetical protein